MISAAPNTLLPVADFHEHDGVSAAARLILTFAASDSKVLYNPLVVHGPPGSGKTSLLAFLDARLSNAGRVVRVDAAHLSQAGQLATTLRARAIGTKMRALLIDNAECLGDDAHHAWLTIEKALDQAYDLTFRLPAVVIAGNFPKPWHGARMLVGTMRAMSFHITRPSAAAWPQFVFHMAQAFGVRVETEVRAIAAADPMWPSALVSALLSTRQAPRRDGAPKMMTWPSLATGGAPQSAALDTVALDTPLEPTPGAASHATSPERRELPPPPLALPPASALDVFPDLNLTALETTRPRHPAPNTLAARRTPRLAGADAPLTNPWTVPELESPADPLSSSATPLPAHLHAPDSDASLIALVMGNVNDVFIPAALGRLLDDRFGAVVALTGGPGTGKTAHLHAFANHLGQQRRGLRVGVADGDDIVGKVQALAAALDPEVDLLVLDDLGPIIDNAEAQAALGLVLRTYRASGRRVLLALAASPQDTRGLTPLLDAELRHGFVVSLSGPDLSMRRKLAETFLRRTRCPFDATGVTAIAERPVASIRDMEGGIFRIAAHATAHKRVVSATFLQETTTRQVMDDSPLVPIASRARETPEQSTKWPPPLDPERTHWHWRTLTDLLVADVGLGPLSPRLVPLQTQRHPTTGDLRGPDDIIHLLQALRRRSGRLAIYAAPRLAELYVKDGQIVHAHIINRRDRLGDSLVLQGALTADDLKDALAEQRTTKAPLGIILRDLGYVAEDVLADAVRRQVEDAIHDVFVWRNALYTFTEGVMVERVDSPVSVSPLNLALDSHRRQDEWHLIRTFVPDFNSCYRLVADAATTLATIPPPAHMDSVWPRLVPLFDGHNSVSDICRTLGFREYVGGTIMVTLIRNGLVEQTTTTIDQRESRQRTINELRTCVVALIHAGLLYYAKLACDQVLALAPTDALARFYLAYLKAEKGARVEAAAELTALATDPLVGPSASLNAAVAHAALGDGPAAAQWLEWHALETMPDHWLLSAGYIAMQARKYQEAENFLRRYQAALKRASPDRTTPPAAFFFLLGTLYCAWGRDAKVLGNEAEATKQFANGRAALAAGVNQYPDAWEIAGNYTALLIEQGDVARAREALTQAFLHAQQEPTLHMLRGDIAYRQRDWGDALSAYQAALTYRYSTARSPERFRSLYERLAESAAKHGDKALATTYGLQAMSVSSDPLSTSIRLERFDIEMPALAGDGRAE